jgi:hypothetical protein
MPENVVHVVSATAVMLPVVLRPARELRPPSLNSHGIGYFHDGDRPGTCPGVGPWNVWPKSCGVGVTTM